MLNTENLVAHLRLAATEIRTLPAGQAADHLLRDTQDPADINIKIGSANTQQSSIQSAWNDVNINIFLAGMQNVFTKSPKASRDTRIDICIEIAKQSDQLKTLVRVQHTNPTDNQQKERETDQDQVFLDCISRCVKRKPSEAADALSRSFSGSADFSFERGSNFYPEQYSITHALVERTFFVASKETYKATEYSIELFLYYLAKRRRWQRVHVYVTAANKTGDLAMIPISATDQYEYLVWKPLQSFVQMLESVLQDLELVDPVARVYLPLYCHAGGTFQYDFESVQVNVDCEQKHLLETIEGDTIKRLRDMGCTQYQESQLISLKRVGANAFLVTDGSSNYLEYKAPFARTAWTTNEFEVFIEDMMQARSLSDCQGVVKFVGVVLDDHRNHIRGYLIESVFSALRRVISFAQLKNYIIPRTLRRYWAQQLVASVSEVHSKGMAIGDYMAISISHSLDLRQSRFPWILRYRFGPTGHQSPELRNGKDLVPESIESTQKRDVFQLGLNLWYLCEHVAFANRHLCLMAGCTTRPYYSCLDATHRNPISLPFSQRTDPVLRGIIEKCRMKDPDKRPSAQELGNTFINEFGFEDNEIEISHQKNAFRTVMKDIWEHPLNFIYCDECMIPILSYHFHCNICFSGNFDLCGSCVAGGVHCLNGNHQLLKIRQDSLGNLIQEFHRPS